MALSRVRPLVPLAAAVVGPILLCLALVPVRSDVENTNAALLLVIVIVAVATFGNRLSGVLAALVAGLAFDFFLTSPYESLAIHHGRDVETDVLLLAVGAAVTEIAMWGRRQHALAGQSAGYLAGLYDASETAANRTLTPPELIERLCGQLTLVLGLRGCRFDYGTGLGFPRLRHDGRVTVGAAEIDVDEVGLPTDHEIELLVESGGSYRGRFLLTAPPRCRPTLEQRSVAASLADQAVLHSRSTRREARTRPGADGHSPRVGPVMRWYGVPGSDRRLPGSDGQGWKR